MLKKKMKENRHGGEGRFKCCECPMPITFGIFNISEWRLRTIPNTNEFPF